MAELRRTVLGMLAAGALIAGLRAALIEPPSVDLDTETLLVEQALAAGWAHTDPIVRNRLVENLRFAGREGTEAELLAQALDLGMDRTDPVVRLHLAARARRALESVPDPSEAQLQDWLAAHPDRFRRAPIALIEQQLVDGHVPGLEPRMAGTLPQLERRLGVSLDGARAGQELERTSPWGTHRIQVVQIEPGALPPLAQIRAEVRQDWQRAHRDQVVQERLAALRRAVAR